jgi:beta-lactamase superfamily II metal-dependent hydrolase
MRFAHRPAILALAVVLSSLVLLAPLVWAQIRAGNALGVYLIDVEGGNATLFVTPSGESLLIDTGNGGAAATRDADRIMAAVKDAGISQIDHLITTHYHGDHFGGMAELAARIPIRHFIDHGPNVQPNPNTDAFLEKTYPELYAKGRHTVVKPGDRIPMTGLDVRVLTSAGEAIKTPVAGAGAPNPLCASFKPQDADKTENAQSVGSLVTFGRFRTLHLGDLTVNKEFDLMCPTNRVGTVDLFVVSHHGQPVSNADILVHAIRSRVAIMNNGTRKGGQPDAMKVIHSAPGLEDLWQLHFSLLSGQEYTVPGLFIANDVDESQSTMPIAAMTPPQPGAGAPPPPVHNGPAFWIKALAQQDGTFTVTNGRNGFAKTYTARR